MLVFCGGTGSSIPPAHWSLESSCRRNSPHPWSRIDVLSPAFWLTLLPGLFDGAGGRPRHMAHLQVLDEHDRLVFADRCRALVQQVESGADDLGVNLPDPRFRAFPVLAALLLAAQSRLRLRQPVLVPFEAVERLEELAGGQGGEASHADAHLRGRRMDRRRDLTLGLDREEPLDTRLPDCDVAHLTKDLPAVAVAYPAELG